MSGICVRHGVTGNWNGIYCDILMGIGLYRAVFWWLRAPCSGRSVSACGVLAGGGVDFFCVCLGVRCARPALAGKYAEIR